MRNDLADDVTDAWGEIMEGLKPYPSSAADMIDLPRARDGLAGRALAVLVTAVILVATCRAQNVPSAGMTENPCPSPLTMPPELASLSELMLKPETPDPQELSKLQGPVAMAFGKAQMDLRQRDWPNICRYRADNAALTGGAPVQAVFMGDSITEFWALADPTFFSKVIVNRGIGGQTSPQMLLRFYSDVLGLHPKVVHILAGTNDLAGNTGPTTMQDYKNNLSAMCDLATAHGVKVILGSILPTGTFPWRPDIKPASQIIELNAWMRDYAASHHLMFVDYHSVLRSADGAMRADLTHDGVHPHRGGYTLMKPLADGALLKALK